MEHIYSDNTPRRKHLDGPRIRCRECGVVVYDAWGNLPHTLFASCPHLAGFHVSSIEIPDFVPLRDPWELEEIEGFTTYAEQAAFTHSHHRWLHRLARIPSPLAPLFRRATYVYSDLVVVVWTVGGPLPQCLKAAGAPMGCTGAPVVTMTAHCPIRPTATARRLRGCPVLCGKGSDDS